MRTLHNSTFYVSLSNKTLVLSASLSSYSLVSFLFSQIKCIFRRSMWKFECSDRHLNWIGVKDFSKPGAFGYLNEQIVVQLSFLGIQSILLLQKQREYHELLNSSLDNIFFAFKLLWIRGEYEAAKSLVSAERIPSTAVERICGVIKFELEKWKKELKKRRFMLPPESSGSGVSQKAGKEEEVSFSVKEEAVRTRVLEIDSRYLYGVADPTEELQDGECFVQPTVDGKSYVIEGRVLVTRNPCYYPGKEACQFFDSRCCAFSLADVAPAF